MQWVCIIGEADKRNNRGEDIVFKHQYLEVKGCQRYFVAPSTNNPASTGQVPRSRC